MNNFIPSAAATLEFARLIACELGHTYIGSEHLLLALLSESDSGEARRIFEHFKITYTDILQRTVSLFGKGEKTKLGSEAITPRLSSIIEKSRARAKKDYRGILDSRLLAISLLSDTECVAVKLIELAGAKRIKVLNLFLSSVENEKKLTLDTEAVPDRRENILSSRKLTPLLNKYGHDLVEMAFDGKYSELIGRERECERVIRVLMRRGKNNPCLIGEPGVGKTAIAEGVARLIVDGRVPEALLSYRIVSLDISSVVAGAKYRGDFEERIRTITDEVAKAGNVILFIDEVHNIVGAGSAEGAVDAANILKPALARDEIKIIGATTLDEYKKYIEKDSALERRFQPILVREPTAEETLEILRGIRRTYEDFHGVKITDEALTASLELSSKYVNDRFLPDKAIDLMDEAASKKRIMRGDKVTGEDIASCLAESLGIPLGKISERENVTLTRLSDNLKKKIIGQDKAVELLADAHIRSRLSISDGDRVQGAYLFVGPTGVGKTELARLYASEIFGENGYIRLDMSEFSESHSVSKLIGAPPGYVGFDDKGGKLEKIRRNPYSVVVFDEIEKAHRDVVNLLLQILDNGVLTNSQGVSLSFKNAVVILTSNIGSSTNKLAHAGFGEVKAGGETLEDVRRTLSPELVSRLDEIIIFSPLSRESLEKIALGVLEEFKQRCQKRGILLDIKSGVLEKIVDMSDKVSGARGVRNTVKKEIENKASSLLISSGAEETVIEISADTNGIDVKIPIKSK